MRTTVTADFNGNWCARLMTVATRDQLAMLWLPWCVRCCERTLPIVDRPSCHPDATQLDQGS